MCRESEGTDSREALRRSLEITIRPLVSSLYYSLDS